jgi:hypothetical protein
MLKDLIAEAAKILAFPQKAGVPTTQVAGMRLVLSNYWPAMDLGGDDEVPGGAKLIKGPGTDTFRYLWIYDTEAKYVYMWRVSDGDAKVDGTDKQLSGDLQVLQKRGQLNRVKTAEARAISKAMSKTTDDLLASLRASIEANKDDLERQLDVKLKARVGEVVQPLFFKALADIKQQVTPIGFKAFGDAVVGNASWTRQAASHVLGVLWKKHMNEPDIEAWLKKTKFQVDQLGNQDIQFALSDLYYQYADEWLP